ncbi:MAG: nucleoside triphosphate pyrophosphohydrolase [Candidatus Caldarchaeum sp.]
MKKSFTDVVELSRRLRGPEGCPWDRAQTLDNLKGYIIEEAYEVIEAIEKKEAEELKEEFGDLLYQVVFGSQIMSEQGVFDIDDVIEGLYYKLVRRHPHVFGEETARNAAEALRIWHGQKNREKARSIVDIPRSMPALARAQRVGDKASHVGFDWKSKEDVLGKLKEEVEELERAIKTGSAKDVEKEWGDVAFSLVNLARFLRLDAESAAHKAVEGFINRFIKVEDMARKRGKDMHALSLEEMDDMWEEVKRAEAG